MVSDSLPHITLATSLVIVKFYPNPGPLNFPVLFVCTGLMSSEWCPPTLSSDSLISSILHDSELLLPGPRPCLGPLLSSLGSSLVLLCNLTPVIM
jgi:hypothetical protein